MKKRRVLIIIVATLLLALSPVLITKVSKTINDRILTSKVDYIEIPSLGKKFYIKKIEIIKPTIWKGSIDGILHYKDQSTAEINISYYGDFYGIKGQESSLFSNGVLYHYTIK